ERLAAEFPAVMGYAVDLGGSYYTLGDLIRDDGRPQDALPWYARAVARLEPVVAAEPRVDARRLLRNARTGRAEALGRLGHPAAALADWDAARDLDDGSARAAVQSGRAAALKAVARTADAVADATAP